MYIDLQRQVENTVITSYNPKDPNPNLYKEKKCSKEEKSGNTGVYDDDSINEPDDGKSDTSFILNPISTQDVIKKSQVQIDEENEKEHDKSEGDKIDSNLGDSHTQITGEHVININETQEINPENITEKIDGYFTSQYSQNTKNNNVEHVNVNSDSSSVHNYSGIVDNHLELNSGNTNLYKDIQLTDKIENLVNRIQMLEERSDVFYQKQYIIEKKVAANNQYTRINNIEISGIDEEILHEDLLPTVIRIINQINVPVNYHDIEACHRLYKKTNEKGPPKVIVRFFDRKNALRCHKNKKNLDCIDNYYCGLKNNTNIYIQENVCPTYKSIYDKAYHLYKNNQIQNVWTFKGIVHIRLNNSDVHHKIVHITDLYEHFPDL